MPVLLLTAWLCAQFFEWIQDIQDKEVDHYGAWVLGILVAITDPVEVIHTLQNKKADHKFIQLVELEALCNDGSGILFFNFFAKMAVSDHPKVFSIGLVVKVLIVGAVGAFLFGQFFRGIC